MTVRHREAHNPPSHMAPRDTQLVELLGRHRLIGELLRDGLEVAIPARDRGIDLIAYADLSHQVGKFVARPIQMKVASVSGFGVERKYKKISDLIIAFVWHLSDPSHAVTYALTYLQGERIADDMGWTRTASWEKSEYATTRPSRRLLEYLQPYRMSSGKWWSLVTGLSGELPAGASPGG
jgi:hypothetical protein